MSTNVGSLSGRAAIVTGASRGLGRVFAFELAAAGADVCLVARSAEGLAETAALIATTGVGCELIVGDVCDDRVAAETAARTLARFGRIDLLINNAGASHPAAVDGQSIEEWWNVVTTNLRAPVAWTQAVLPTMRQQRWGRIVNLSSPGAWHTPLAFFSSYTASKAGLTGFTAVLAQEVAEAGIAAIAFGPVAATDMARGTYENDVVPEPMRDAFRAAFTTDPERLMRMSTELFRCIATGAADHCSGSYLGFGPEVPDTPDAVVARPPTPAGMTLEAARQH